MTDELPIFPHIINIDSIIESIIQNWVMIVITIAVAILTTLITIVINHRIQTNAAEERFNRGKEEMLRILDEHLITGKEMYPDRLDNIMLAIDREHSIDFSTQVSKVSILRDLQYRIESSSQLNSEEKDNYSDRIESAIAEVEMLEADSGIDNAEEVIAKVKEAINEGDDELAKDRLEDLQHAPQPQVNAGTSFEVAESIFVFSITMMVISTIVFALDLGIGEFSTIAFVLATIIIILAGVSTFLRATQIER